MDSTHPTCGSIRKRRMATISAQPFIPVWPMPAQSHPTSQEVRCAEVKQEADARPQAIYLNINPTMLPILIQFVRQFCHKYLDSTSPATIDDILRKVAKVQLTITRFVGIRELVAAVVYCQYSDRIRLKLKDYSSLNQLHQKIFNKKYVAYQTILKRQASQSKEQKLEEDQKEEEEKDSEEDRTVNRGFVISSRKQAIELIYDGIFQTPYFQLNRREVIQKMAMRCEEIDEKVFQAMTWTASHTLKLYYAIFAYLKTLGMNVGFTKYREAVYNFAGYTLKRELAYLVQRLLKTVSREKTDHSGQDSSDSHSNQPQ